MEVLFENEYEGTLFSIKEDDDNIYLLIDNEQIIIIDSDDFIDYKIESLIPLYMYENNVNIIILMKKQN